MAENVIDEKTTADRDITKMVQFSFTSEAYKELVALQSDLRMATKAEVIRHALRVLQWLISESSAHRRILVEDDGGKLQEVIFPFLTQKVDRPK